MKKEASSALMASLMLVMMPAGAGAQEIPSFYDIRLADPADRSSYFDGSKCLVNAVENQGSANICWAFTASTALESNVYKNWQRQNIPYGVDTKAFRLSPWKMAWLAYARPTGERGELIGAMGKPLKGSYYEPLANRVYGHGSWPLFAPEYLSSSGIGFRKAGRSLSEDLQAPETWGEDVGLRIRNIFTNEGSKLYQPKEIQRMKRMVMEYGALAAGINSQPLKQQGAVDFYHDKPMAVNHGVNIVGWDDDYDFSGSGLKVKPKYKGAWIIRNSWGQNWGKDGYGYLSYEDKTLANYVAYDTTLDQGEYDWIDTHERTNRREDPGKNWENWSSPRYRQVMAGSGFSAGYTARAAGTLQAVGFYSMADTMSYTIEVRTGSLDPNEGTERFRQSGTFGKDHSPEWAGYRTVKLEEPVKLAKDEPYTVSISLKSPKGKVMMIYAPNLVASYKLDTVHSYYRRGSHGKWKPVVEKAEGNQPVWYTSTSVVQRAYIKAAK